MRANADAIAVGVGTVLADDPALTVRDVPCPAGRAAPRRLRFHVCVHPWRRNSCARRARFRRSIVGGAEPIPIEPPDGARGRRRRACSSSRVARATRSRSLRRERRALAVSSRAGRGSPVAARAKSLVDRLIIFRSSLVLGTRRARGVRLRARAGSSGRSLNVAIVANATFRRRPHDDLRATDVPCSPD